MYNTIQNICLIYPYIRKNIKRNSNSTMIIMNFATSKAFFPVELLPVYRIFS